LWVLHVAASFVLDSTPANKQMKPNIL